MYRPGPRFATLNEAVVLSGLLREEGTRAEPHRSCLFMSGTAEHVQLYGPAASLHLRSECLGAFDSSLDLQATWLATRLEALEERSEPFGAWIVEHLGRATLLDDLAEVHEHDA